MYNIVMTTSETEFEQELKEYLTFLMWADKIIDEYYLEEINQEFSREENNH